MSLNVNTLQDKIASAFLEMAATAAAGSNDQREAVISQLAESLAMAIHNYVSNAKVNIESVSNVSTGNEISGPGIGTLT